jgi:hypothetical protein
VGMIPHEKTLVERLKNKPFALLGVNTDKDKDEYRKKAAEMGVTWRSSWQGSTSGPWPLAWGVSSYPTIYVIDHKGLIRFEGLRGERLDAAVDQLLKEMEAGR